MKLLRWTPHSLIIVAILVLVNAPIGQYAWGQTEEKAIEEGNPNGLVEVEPNNIVPGDSSGEYIVVSYRQRREKWGATWGLGYSSYTPENYEPNYLTANFDEVYGSVAGLIELQGQVKRNTFLGSAGIEFGLGFFQKTTSESGKSTLQMIPVFLGLQLTLDNLMPEPYLAPYIAGGVYTMIYSEKQGSSDFGGNTQASTYAKAGLLIQMNWMDRQAAVESYQESGIENTFIYIEGRMMMASQDEGDPDFSSTHFDAGVKVEF